MLHFFKWYYESANLRKKLLISYFLLVLLPILFLGIYSYNSSKDSFLEQTELTMEDAATSMQASLDSIITREDDNIRYLTYNAYFRDHLEHLSQDWTAFTRTLSNDMEPIFWYFITSDSNLKWIRIYSPYLSQSIGNFCHAASVVEDEWWYQKSQTYSKTIWRVEGESVYASRTLLDANSSSVPIGVIELELNLERLTEAVHQIYGNKSGTLLFDSQGEVIFRSSFVDKELEQQVEEYIREEAPNTFAGTEKFLVTGVLELSNGWKFCYFRDSGAIDRELREILTTTILLMIISFGLLMLLGTFVSVMLSRRILRLKDAAEEISRGNFHVEMDLRYNDEIGVVNKSFDRMQQKMNKMIQETYQMGMEKRKTELQALQAKINPHFLYNCLSSIKWRAIKSGEDDIADITGLLAKFYRSTLNDGRAITTVENELDTIISYLEIQKRSHDDSFDALLHLDEEGRKLLVPHFLIQPLVENAILHGVDYLEDEETRGWVEVTYCLEEDYIVFQVRNNGAQLKNDQLAEVLSQPGRGYGLYNIQERIRLYYDNSRCGLSGQVEENGRVCFTVRLGRDLKDIGLEQESRLLHR